MATTKLVLTDTWQALTVSGSHLMVQASDWASLHIAATAPAASADGHTLRNNCLHQIDNFAAIGGSAWVRGAGTLTYSH